MRSIIRGYRLRTWRPLATSVVAVLVTAAVSAPHAQAASAASQPGRENVSAMATQEMATYSNTLTGKCLGISGGNMTNGTKAIQWTCSGAADQSWYSIESDGHYYRLHNAVNYNKCLAVPGSSKTAGVQLVIWDCSNNADQFWRYELGYRGMVFINLYSGMVIAVSGSSSLNGAPVIQWPWSQNDDQMWIPHYS